MFKFKSLEGVSADKVAVINVDDSSKAAKDFLITSGFEHYVDQYEMIMDL